MTWYCAVTTKSQDRKVKASEMRSRAVKQSMHTHAAQASPAATMRVHKAMAAAPSIGGARHGGTNDAHPLTILLATRNFVDGHIICSAAMQSLQLWTPRPSSRQSKIYSDKTKSCSLVAKEAHRGEWLRQ